MEEIYNAIVKVFNDNASVFTNAGISPIRQIDLNYGQIQQPDDFEIFYPAMFIGYTISPERNSSDINLLNLSFYIVMEPQEATDNFSGADSITYLKTIKLVKYLLNRLVTEKTTKLQYTGENAMTGLYYRQHILNYNCNITADDDSIWDTPTIDFSINNLQIIKQ